MQKKKEEEMTTKMTTKESERNLDFMPTKRITTTTHISKIKKGIPLNKFIHEHKQGGRGGGRNRK